ncbi:MAG TPA: sigma-70 family RNA polymerase sigma factor [Gemmatimonadota bacterium]|nr:sigma-70 family RNA polymerase sigma factor [Gemmatimonadota bacterium]
MGERQVRLHDPRAEFEVIYREHHRRVYAIALRFARDPDRAEEVVQDAFVRAWRSLPSFNGDSRLSTWLHSVAVNAALDGVRVRSRREARLDRDVDLDRYAAEVGRAMPGADLDLERAVASLPDGAREIVILHYIEGYPCAEIAEQLGIVEGTVKSQLHRARKLLKEALT